MNAGVDRGRSDDHRWYRHRPVAGITVVGITAAVFGFATIACTSSDRSASSSAGTVSVSASAALTSAPTTSTEPSNPDAIARVWFVRDERLAPVYRSGVVQAVGAIDALLAGPGSSDPADLTSAIPTGTTLRGLGIVGDVAHIDLDSGFESGGGSLSMTERVAQIVYTLTDIPGVTGVAFSLDGTPTASIGGEGIDVSAPVGRDRFLAVKPLILAIEPTPGQVVTSPLRIAGENSTFENNVEVTLRTSDGRVLLETFATGIGPIHDAEGQPVWGPFETAIDFYAGSASSGELALTETASDGSGRLVAAFSVPVTFAAVAVEPPPPLDGASTDAVTVPEAGCCNPGSFVLLTGVTAQRLPGFDRIVFEFSSPPVDYHIRYVPLPVTQDPSDLPVALQGDSALQISMGATGVDLTTSTPRQTYTGPGRIAVGTGSVIELVQTGDFEGVSNWTVGLRGRPPFRVSTEADPPRLVIDVASP